MYREPTGDVDAKFMLNLAIENTPIATLVLLLEAVDTEDDLVGGAVRPHLEPLALHGEVLEALEELDGGSGVAPYLEHAEERLLLGSRPLVAWLVGKLGLGATRLQWDGLPVPALNRAL